jgi:hypothetical protein
VLLMLDTQAKRHFRGFCSSRRRARRSTVHFLGGSHANRPHDCGSGTLEIAGRSQVRLTTFVATYAP